MFLDDIDEIDDLDVRNPGEYQAAYDKVKFLKDLSPYIADEILSNLVRDELASLEHTLDVRITRELIALGYYNPETDAERPDPTIFEYVIPDDEDNDNDNDNDGGDTTTTEVVDDEEPDDNDDSEDTNVLVQFLVPVVILLVTIVLMVVNTTIRRRRA
jgi:hypothetical protein